MTAGTVVITGGILATVILLCIIAVLCYCRLQVPPGALREARGGLGPHQRGRGRSCWRKCPADRPGLGPTCRGSPLPGLPKPPPQGEAEEAQGGEGTWPTAHAAAMRESSRSERLGLASGPLGSPFPTHTGRPSSAPQPREQAQMHSTAPIFRLPGPPGPRFPRPHSLPWGPAGRLAACVRACVRAHARAGGPRVTSPLPAVLLLQGRVGGGRGGA